MYPSVNNTKYTPIQLMKDPPRQEYPAADSSDAQDYLVAYYNVESVEELVHIMISPHKSQAYNYVRSHSPPHAELQNFNTVRAVLQYRRGLLLSLLGEGQAKGRGARENRREGQARPASEKVRENAQRKLSVSSQGSSSPTRNQGQDSPSVDPLAQIAGHSYQQLSVYFKINYNPVLCRQILQHKYSHHEVIRSHRLRQNFWLLLIGMQHKREQYPSMYQHLSSYEGYRDFFTRTIHADVIRTVHDSDDNIKKQNMARMQRILQCFARRNPYIGYCQGMNFITSFIMTMQFEEEECFWILASVLEDMVPIGYYTNMSGVAVDLKILQLMISHTRPQLLSKLAQLNVDISIFGLEWLVCLYTSTLPFYLLIVVWDLMLIEGSMALLKVALILMEYLEGTIKEATDFAHFFKLYDNVKKKIYIQEQTLITKYNNLYIDNKILALLREVLESEVRQSKQQARRNMKQNQKWKQVQCSHQLPICFQQLRRQKLDDSDLDVWTLRDQAGPKLISDYLLQRRKPIKLGQQPEDIGKKLVIGRIPHICTSTTYSKEIRWVDDSVELEEVERVGEGGRIVVRPLQDMDRQHEGQGESVTDFFRRATLNKFSFDFMTRSGRQAKK